jgi:hypothetical protein
VVGVGAGSAASASGLGRAATPHEVATTTLNLPAGP